MFCKKDLLRNFAKFLRTPSFKEYLMMAASERVNADEAAPLCSVAVGKQNIGGEA